jgi:glycosyltransferase involved in cell wall biosynthesis
VHPPELLDYGALHAAGVNVHGAEMRQLAKRYYSRTSRRFGTEIASIPHGIISRYGMGVASAAVVASRVLLFGSIDEWKGVEYFIQAERSVRKAIPEVKFIIAGSSSDPDYYRSLVGDGNACTPIKLQTSEEVRGLFAMSISFVFHT